MGRHKGGIFTYQVSPQETSAWHEEFSVAMKKAGLLMLSCGVMHISGKSGCQIRAAASISPKECRASSIVTSQRNRVNVFFGLNYGAF